MATWNRRVSATADGDHLQVDEQVGQGNSPNPPGRSDGPGDITVHPGDKPAKIKYKADGVTLTGIRMKNGQPVPNGLTVTTKPNGDLEISDNGPDNADYSYYIVGNYSTNSGIETEDPQIHNRPS